MRYPDEAAGFVALGARVCRRLPSNHPLGTAGARSRCVEAETAAAGGLARNTGPAAAGEIAVLHLDEAA